MWKVRIRFDTLVRGDFKIESVFPRDEHRDSDRPRGENLMFSWREDYGIFLFMMGWKLELGRYGES